MSSSVFIGSVLRNETRIISMELGIVQVGFITI